MDAGALAGRVGHVLEVDDVVTGCERLRGLGVEFGSAPRVEPYGTLAVFRDVTGNRWDLLSTGRTRAGMDPAGGGARSRRWRRPRWSGAAPAPWR